MRRLFSSVFILICLTFLFAALGVAQNRTQDDRFVVRVNKKYGFIDRTGKVVIEPQFDSATDFANGRAVVFFGSPNYESYYIDSNGKVIETADFSYLSDFSEGLAAVGIGQFISHGGGDHWFGFVDSTGKLTIETTFREARSFSEGLAAVMDENGKWGFIDKSGQVVIPFQFSGAFDFSDGMACVLLNDLFGFVDRSGKVVIPPRFALPAKFNEGLAAVEIAPKNFKAWSFYGSYGSAGGKLAVIDKTGAEAFALAKNVVKVDEFSEGLARVDIQRGKNYFYTAFIDRNGKSVFKLPFYSSTGKFSEGLCLVQKNQKFGFIDRNGKIVIAPVYKWAEDFRNGLASISTSQQLWERKRKGPYDFDANFHTNAGYIDKTGKVVWKPSK